MFRNCIHISKHFRIFGNFQTFQDCLGVYLKGAPQCLGALVSWLHPEYPDR